MATLWQQVSEALEAALRQIETSAGYRTDIGQRLRPWQYKAPTWDELPVMEVRAGRVEPGRPAYGLQELRIGADVLIYLPGGTEMQTLRDHAADVMQALGADPTLGGLVDQVRVAEIEVDPGEPERVSDGLRLAVEATVETDPWTL
ncbi:MAG TPA: hypothetical protein ENK62_01895 [Chromatiales bacterium]|nr:hypothetical protein [Chromatiales bacterium]